MKGRFIAHRRKTDEQPQDLERAHTEEAIANLDDSERRMVEKLFAEEVTA